MENGIVIIDGNSLINRAYYAIQCPMITKEGVYTHGVYGFLHMLEKITKEYAPAYMAVAFDRKGPTFRHEAYEDYKAGRKKMPPELAMQLPLLKDVLDALRVRTLEIDGFEADDVIGTVARRAEAAGLDPLIITGDKDALQLATARTKVLITRKGVSEFDLYDEAAMIEKYGFTPTQFIDFKGLMGDSSDNIPGIRGVGEKTALKLIQEYRSVEELIARADEIPNEKLREKIRENALVARMSRKLAEINTAVPIEFDIEALRVGEPDAGRLAGLYIRLEFKTFLKRLRYVPEDGEAYAPPPSDSGEGYADIAAAARTRYESLKAMKPLVVSTEAERTALAEAAARAEYAVIRVYGDQNRLKPPRVRGLSLIVSDAAYYIPLESAPSDMSLSALYAWTAELLKSFRRGVAGHDTGADIYTLTAIGIRAGEVPVCFDTAVAQYLLDPLRNDYELNLLTLEHFRCGLDAAGAEAAGGGMQIDMLADTDTNHAERGNRSCAAAGALIPVLRAKLDAEDLTRVFETAELPLITALAAAEAAGFRVDKRVLAEVGDGLSREVESLTAKIYALAGEEFNIKSPARIGVILFEKLGLPSTKKSKVGYATGADVLEKLRDRHEIVGRILEYRMLTKLTGTYVDGLLPLVGEDGRIHARFRQTVTATGRISCMAPNLQNIPVKQEQGRTIRKAFVPDEEHLLIGADYSQIELRILAHLTGDAALTEDFRQGADIHRRTASRVFEVAEDEVTPLLRSRAKAVNFGVIYGMSGFGLSEELGIARKDAARYIAEYFRAHESVRAFMDEQIEFCRRNGYVTTLLGRRRRIPEITATTTVTRQLGERLAMNTPIQGSAADVIKLAMIGVDRALRTEGLRSRLILQVHDELIIEARREEQTRVEQILREEMEGAYALDVPLTVEINAASDWYSLK